MKIENNFLRLDKKFIDRARSFLAEGRALHKKLPACNGEIYIERQLPFLCIYRYPASVEQHDWGTDKLLTGESSFLTAPGDKASFDSLQDLVQTVSSVLKESYGAFLVVEIWAGNEVLFDEKQEARKPGFSIFVDHKDASLPFVKTLAKELSLISLDGVTASVEMNSSRDIAPENMERIAPGQNGVQDSPYLLGLEVSPVYRDSSKQEHFNMILEDLKSQLTKALEKMFFEFLKQETKSCPPSYLALGKQSRVHSVMQVDRVLFEVAEQIDFLLLVTPTNSQEAYAQFKHNLYQREPKFTYHPAPFDPVLLKRELYSAKVEEIEDPTLAQLFREQQMDIDHRIAMISKVGQRNFLYSSLQLFEKPSDSLVNIADRLLSSVDENSESESLDKQLTAEEFRSKAQKELDYYREQRADLPATVQIRDDVPGVLVSQGNLIIGSQRRVLENRAEALLSHEVGTHILTNYNGKAQPFRQMSAGLPGYDELQEPLAVLSEYLVGGLSNRRIRTLAARVLAVHWMVDGATFVEVFHKFVKDYGLHKEIAYSITMRVFRGGGFTKDVVYLRGLVSLLEHLRHGLDIELLYLGKFGLNYLPIIRELTWRNVLVQAQLKPRYFESEKAMERLKFIQSGASVFDLVES